MKSDPVRVFVIDDDATSNMLFGLTLQRLFADPIIRFFYDPADAFEAIEAASDEPMHIFVEINMKIANGWSVVQRLQGLRLLSANIFMLASAVSAADQKAAQMCGITAILTKPFNVGSLRQIGIATTFNAINRPTV